MVRLSLRTICSRCLEFLIRSMRLAHKGENYGVAYEFTRISRALVHPMNEALRQPMINLLASFRRLYHPPCKWQKSQKCAKKIRPDCADPVSPPHSYPPGRAVTAIACGSDVVAINQLTSASNSAPVNAGISRATSFGVPSSLWTAERVELFTWTADVLPNP